MRFVFAVEAKEVTGAFALEFAVVLIVK